MTPPRFDPRSVMLAKQRAKTALGLAAAGFALVGAIAWVGLEAVRVPASVERPQMSARPGAAEQLTVTVTSAEPVVDPTADVTPRNCVDRLQAFAEAQTIRFGSGRADLESSELPILRQIGEMAEACPNALIRVAGHSDTSGSDIINLALSWQRADNTVATLAALGIDTTRFEPIGYGARAPFTQGDASDDELNRRVEFQVLTDTEADR